MLEPRPMDILVVEDEAKVRKFLEEALRSEGHNVQACESVEEAEAWMRVEGTEAEVAILDRMLGDSDGLSLVRPLKSRFPDCKVIILSAIGLADEKATALDGGADDYISKPFSLAELSARIRAISRRRARGGAIHIMLGNLVIDLKTQNVSTESHKIDCSKKEFQLLSTLATHPRRVFTKYQLLDRIWNTQADIESNIVEVTVKNLRRKLEGAESGAKVLSKRNVGYWIEA